MTRANLDKRPGEVSAMFDKVADRYDLMNDVLSLGQDRWWRRIVARAVGARPGELVLDLAAGTGTSSRTFTAGGASCVACDFSLGMLQVGARRMRSARLRSAQPRSAQPRSAQPGRPAGEAAGRAGQVRFVAGDALQLPFRDQAFDAVTISFGLRNVADPAAALGEMLRVTRPGGRLVICEFGHLPWPRFNTLYESYLATALPAVARRLSGSPEAYDYLAESIRDWPPQAELARRMAAAGWSAVRWRNLTLGVVAVHLARRPR
jgi:demethylmenaquinone methyltransferase / 2-methoxy-6-polyprenyl-1,4-benzoquinol methylase